MKEQNNKYIIYKYTSPSGKIYIGQTSQTLEQRMRIGGKGYLRKNKNGEYVQPAIAKAILKYGFENFQKEILFENLTKEEANQKEMELISFYHSNDKKYGYNCTKGGEGVTHSEEYKLELSEKMKSLWGDTNSVFRKMAVNRHIPMKESSKAKSSLTHKKIWENKTLDEKLEYSSFKMNNHKINQYDLDGNLIKQWDNFKELELNGFERGSIWRVCSKKSNSKGIISKTYKGFQWRYSDDCEDIKPYKRPSKYREDSKSFRKIALVDDCGNVLKIYLSLSEAARELSLNTSAISMVCQGKYKQTKGYKFKYIEKD